MADNKVPQRIAINIINALQGGVVPRTGLGYIAVGRTQELKTLVKDLDNIENGGAAFRFIVGNYGSGKTFLLQTIKEYAVQKGFVVADVDLSPDRSLVGSAQNRKGLATYRALLSNLSIKTRPDGGALEKVLDNWLNRTWMENAQTMSGEISGLELNNLVHKSIYSKLHELQEEVYGYNFSDAIEKYWLASKREDINAKEKALKWLRGEYQTKREAYYDCGIDGIINDDNWFDYIKLFSEFFVKIGYKGFIVMIDEMINIYRINNSISRQKNYEKMLFMYNDALQGRTNNLGIFMGGTPKSLESMERGVFSYEALRSRLQTAHVQDVNIVDMMTPIIRIQQLSKSELIVLLGRIADIHADVYMYEKNIEDRDCISFIETAYSSLHKNDIRPRNIIKDFITFLNIIQQNPDEEKQSILLKMQFSIDPGIDYYANILDS